MLAFAFVAPLLLLGLLATLIPLLLHLLARSRAQEVLFPTLRFLKLSMEKTARRRKIQHVFLMALRMLLLAMLALAVAQPYSEAIGGWLGGQRYVAVVILDNSMSMATVRGSGKDHTTRLEKAKYEAGRLLSSENKPVLAALLTTNGGMVSTDLSSRLEQLRDEIAKTPAGNGKAPLAQRLTAAVEMLLKDSTPQKSIYLFTDLQKVSAEELLRVEALVKAKDQVHLLIVDTADRQVNNVGISELKIDGDRIVDKPLGFTATLMNSSATDRVVDVGMRINGNPVGQKSRVSLRSAGQDGSTATVRFFQTFSQVGNVTGDVMIDQVDDLPRDNMRRFSLRLGGRIKALIVRGPGGGAKNPILDPATTLTFALDPYSDKSIPWFITPTLVEGDQFASASLAGQDIVYFCDMPAFNDEQARAVEQFAAAGGSVVFFLGANVDVKNYNQRFMEQIKAEGGLLPATIAPAVGEVGPMAAAQAVDFVEVDHPFFKGFYDNLADYCTASIQRYYKLVATGRTGKALVRLKNGDSLLLEKTFGSGRVVLCATGASPVWSNLPTTGLFAMVIRMSLLARQDMSHDENYLADAQVEIRPPIAARDGNELPVNITLPDSDEGKGQTITVAARRTGEGYLASFADTSRVGFYNWRVAGGVDEEERDKKGFGTFAVNPQGSESQLQPMDAEALTQGLKDQEFSRAYIASSLDEVNATAAAQAQPRNWWDVLMAIAILVLVVEALAANRLRKPGESNVPSHLNPKIAG